MGKIRVKSFEEATPEEEAKLKAKREQKKADKARVSGMGGGQRINTVGPTEEELMAQDTPKEATVEVASLDKPKTDAITRSDSDEAISEDKPKKQKKEKFAKAAQKVESKRHKENLTTISNTQKYDLDQALAALKKFKTSKFDETVELHINTKEKGISGQITLPHGTGKTRVIKIADDAIIAEVAKGKIDFDVLVAAPSMMPNLARVAKVLGPRGLMPNPKNGTISDNPEEAVKKLAGGQMTYKTESDAPIIHAVVGKVSFDDAKLKENITAFLTTVGTNNISSVTLKSTMSPGIRLQA